MLTGVQSKRRDDLEGDGGNVGEGDQGVNGEQRTWRCESETSQSKEIADIPCGGLPTGRKDV